MRAVDSLCVRWFSCLLVFALAGCGATIETGGGFDFAASRDDGDPPLDGSVVERSVPLDGGGCAGAGVCDGGACLGGQCCPLAAACGASCCAQGTVCLSDRCVRPGQPCRSPSDCLPGQYCEPALVNSGDGGSIDGGVGDGGVGDGGVGDGSVGDGSVGDGGLCTQPAAPGGRCLDAPKVCADGGVRDGGCLAPCEYHPPVGQLDPVIEWRFGPRGKEYPDFTDVWATPAVGRLYDANCDGRLDEQDPPNVIFVAGNVAPSNSPRDDGVLRLLDGRTGAEIWALRRASQNSKGFMGLSVAIGDLDRDGRMDIVAVTGEKYLVIVDGTGKVQRTSDKPAPGSYDGWGGGPAIADVDGDGFPEIAFGASLFSTTGGALTLKWTGQGGTGGGNNQFLSTFADLDGLMDNHLELLAGNTAYRADGTVLWQRKDLGDGFPGVGDFDRDGKPEAVLIAAGVLYLLDAASGQNVLPPLTLPGTGEGGPPTVADFDGDGRPEIGVAQANFYSTVKPDFAQKKLLLLWKMPNHDLSSSVTGSSVFDFEGDGRAEVIYADECFLWVFDGPTGKVRFASFTTSFTATEASLVADVDGDGRAEIVMVSNGASPKTWKCLDANDKPSIVNGVTWVPAPVGGPAYRGVTVFGDRSNGWVGSRTIWNQHTYHVTNVCDGRDQACQPVGAYGEIPKLERRNWTVPWLDNFRQNVQGQGLFDAPDATVTLAADCTTPITLRPTVRNLGLTSLPAGVVVGLLARSQGDKLLGKVATSRALFAGQAEPLTFQVPLGAAGPNDIFVARVLVDPKSPTFHQCRNDNDESAPVQPMCIQ